MLLHRFNTPAVGALLAIGIAATAAFVIWKRHGASYPLGVKGDRLDVAPRAGCSKVVWPYGCDWQPGAPVDARTHSRFGVRGKHKHGLIRNLS